VLPGRFRTHLRAVYAFARTVDDLGDELVGDRTAALTTFRADLARIWAGQAPDSPVLRDLAGTVRACGLPHDPFDRLVQVGIRDLSEEEQDRIQSSGGRIVAFYDPELAEARFAGESWAAQCARIVAKLPKLVYVSFDIDGLDPALCPHTGTKVPGGLSFQMATSLIAAVVKSGRRLVGFDLTEVAPAPDGSEWDENVGARILYKLIGWSLASLNPTLPAR